MGLPPDEPEDDDPDLLAIAENLDALGINLPTIQDNEPIDTINSGPRDANDPLSIWQSQPEVAIINRIHRTEYYPGASLTFGRGTTLIEEFQKDRCTPQRQQSNNVYYPFASKDEWEFSNKLMRMPGSLAAKTDLLDTAIVRS